MDFPREKSDLFFWRITYKLNSILTLFLGTSRSLRMHLILHRMSARFAHELSGKVFGSEYHNAAFALSKESLLDSISSEDRVLDVGCGNGRFSLISSYKAREVVSIDHNPNHFKDLNFSAPNIKTLVFNIDDDFSSLGRFDLALLIHILEHIVNPQTLLSKLSRVAQNLIIEVPDQQNDPLNWVRIQLGMEYSSDNDHVREYTLDLITHDLNTTGWSISQLQKKGGAILIFATNQKVY